MSCTYPRVAYGPCYNRLKTAECGQEAVQDQDLIYKSYVAADKLLENMNVAAEPVALKRDIRLWVATITDVNHLERTTPLGRLIGEQLSARFTQQGYTVIDAKLQSELTLIPYQGEFILSRYLQEMARNHQAEAVVAGTYAVGKDLIYITLKLFDLHHQRAMSSFAYTLPLGPNTGALLQEQTWWYGE